MSTTFLDEPKYDVEMNDELSTVMDESHQFSQEKSQVLKQFSKQSMGQSVHPRSGMTLIERIESLLDREIDFVPNTSFSKRSVRTQIESESIVESSPERSRSKAADKVPSSMTALCSTPLLTPEQEVASFRRMNFFKFRFNQLRSKLSLNKPNEAKTQEAEQALQAALDVRDLIIRANLRLVVSVTRKFVTPQMAFDELFSDGVVALMNAVEKFDFDRGYRFSTYAYYSISRSLYRFIKVQRKNRIHSDMLEQTLEMEDDPNGGWNQENWDYVNNELDDMLQQLDRRERWIIRQRYAFEGQAKAPTYKVLAEKLGICNERVRQLEKRALGKLRNLSEDGRLGEILESLNL